MYRLPWYVWVIAGLAVVVAALFVVGLESIKSIIDTATGRAR